MSKPFVWQMIHQAVQSLGGKATNSEIRDYISKNWTDVNENTINAQIIVLTVNQPSRIHYPENNKPRVSTGKYDLLFRVGKGQVVLYNQAEHGLWEIYKNEFGALKVRQVIETEFEEDEAEEAEVESFLFPIEANLRDFLIKNLKSFKGHDLKLFVDETGRDGKEYPTAVGPIDILTIDDQGQFVVFEMKLSKGVDKALGQILRYMGWVKKHLANGKAVKGVIVAHQMDQKIKYAVTEAPNVTLYEYEMKFELNPVAKV